MPYGSEHGGPGEVSSAGGRVAANIYRWHRSERRGPMRRRIAEFLFFNAFDGWQRARFRNDIYVNCA